MKNVPIKKLNDLDLSTVARIRDFAKRTMERPNEVVNLSPARRKDGFTFYIARTGSPLFKPGIILTARYKERFMILSPISGTSTEADLTLLMDMIQLEDGEPNFKQVSENLKASGKVTRTEISN